MDVIIQYRGIFYKFGCSGKDYVEAFNFRVQITKDVRNVKEFKETTRSLFLLFFLSPFYTTTYFNPEVSMRGGATTTNLTFELENSIYTSVSLWPNI